MNYTEWDNLEISKSINFVFDKLYKNYLTYISECNKYKFDCEIEDKPDLKLKMDTWDLWNECKESTIEVTVLN